MLFDADVEPYRGVERRHLVEKDVGELVAEGVAIGLGGEVATLASPAGHGAHDAADELADGGLAIGGVEVAAEVLRDHDVRGHLRPELRHLDVLLLEDDVATLVGDEGRSEIPLAGVVGVDTGLGVEALDGDAAAPGFLASRLRLGGIRS